MSRQRTEPECVRVDRALPAMREEGTCTSGSSVELQLLRGLEGNIEKGATTQISWWRGTGTRSRSMSSSTSAAICRDLENSFKVTPGCIADPTGAASSRFVIEFAAKGAYARGGEGADGGAGRGLPAQIRKPSTMTSRRHRNRAEMETDETEGLHRGRRRGGENRARMNRGWTQAQAARRRRPSREATRGTAREDQEVARHRN